MIEEVLNHLQTLNGETLGEVLKSLNILIKRCEKDIRPNIDELLLRFQPKNELEKVVRVKLMNHFECEEEVLNILKSEDIFYISHAIRCSWFFRKLGISSDELVNKVFPFMSYSTRLKILKCYSRFLKDTDVSDFFKSVKERYGLRTAFILLPRCSENFIEMFLVSITMQVPFSVLQEVFKVYPVVVINYLKFLLECISSRKRVFRNFRLSLYRKLFHVLASEYPTDFAQMVAKYQTLIPNINLGRRSTRRLVCSEFTSFKKNIHIYKKLVNWKNIVMVLSLDQISELQLAYFPPSVSEFFSTYSNFQDYMLLTSSLKVKQRQKMLIKNFRKVYERDIRHYIISLDADLVVQLPEDIREEWVEMKLPEEDSITRRADYISYLPTEKSLPTLKKMIQSQTDVNCRAYLVKCLFRTITVNQSWHLIGEVCQYVVKRFRNDQYIVKDEMISALYNTPELIKIKDEEWAPIEEFISIMIINNEAFGSQNSILKIMSVQILSRLERELPVEPYLLKLLRFCDPYYEFNLCEKTPYEKLCLMWFVENIHQKFIKSTESDEEDLFIIKLFTRICIWNRRHHAHLITVPNWIIKKLQSLFFNRKYSYKKNMILQALKYDRQLKHSFYNELFPKYCDHNILLYKLHREPNNVLTFLDGVMKAIYDGHIKPYNSFFKQAKLYSYIHLPEKICNYCLDLVHGKESLDDRYINVKSKSILILSLLQPTNKFVDVISAFYPKEKTVGDYSDEGREIYSIQREISASLKVVNSPSEVLESLKKFAVGDYLKLVVGSINSICLRTPEYRILPLLKEWFDCPVSLRKHFIRAYFRIAPVSYSMEIAVQLFETEKNSSLRLLAFEHTFRCFVSEASCETFSVLKVIMKKLSISDEPAIGRLYDIDNISDDFIYEYIQLFWNVLENKAPTNKAKQKLISQIEPSILRLLNEEFCDILIKEVIGVEIFPVDLTVFLVRYLLYSQNLKQLDHRSQRLVPFFEQLALKWNNYDLKEVEVFRNRRILSIIVEIFVRESFNVNDSTISLKKLLKDFQTILEGEWKDENVIEEVLLLEISCFFHSCTESEIMLDFSNYIQPILATCSSLYDVAVIETVCSIVIKVLQWKFKDSLIDERRIILAEKLISFPTKYSQIFGIKILPDTITSNIQRYKKILDLIPQINDRTVQFFASKFYRNLSSTVKLE